MINNPGAKPLGLRGQLRSYCWPHATGTTPEQNIPLAEHENKEHSTAPLDIRKLRGKIRGLLRKRY